MKYQTPVFCMDTGVFFIDNSKVNQKANLC